MENILSSPTAKNMYGILFVYSIFLRFLIRDSERALEFLRMKDPWFLKQVMVTSHT